MKTWSTPVNAVEKENIPCALCGGSDFKPALECEGFGFARCSCGLVQMNPQPIKEKTVERYIDTYGKNYLSYEINNEKIFLKLQELALNDAGFFKKEKILLRAGNPPSILDVGCATGALLDFLRGRGWRVTGVEISPSAEFARKERNLDVRSAPLEECGFPDKSFDIIHASHLIEHLNNPRLFLAEVRRLLKENGRLYISTPNIAGFQARFFGNFWRSAIFDHLYLFSARTLKKLLKDTGYKIERVRTWGGLAEGSAPKGLKKCADFFAKLFGCGDVMIIRAIKSSALKN